MKPNKIGNTHHFKFKTPGGFQFLVFVFMSLSLVFFRCKDSKKSETSTSKTVEQSEEIFSETRGLKALIKSSSAKIPLDRFGPEKLFDDDTTTFWVTTPGAVTGEFFTIIPEEPFMLHTLYFDVPNLPSYCKVYNYKLIVNEEDVFEIFPKQKIEIKRLIHSLKFEFGQTEGMNKVDFKAEIDSTGGKITIFERSSILYTSKSAALSRFDLFDDNGEKILFDLPIYKKVKIAASSVKNPRMQHNPGLAIDENSNTHWAYSDTAVLPQTLLLAFEEYVQLDGIRIKVGNHSTEESFKENSVPDKIEFGLRVGEKYQFDLVPTLKEHYLKLERPILGKVFSIRILSKISRNNSTVAISTLTFTNRGKKIVLMSDSLEYFNKLFTDSIKKTTLKPLIDSYFTYEKKVKNYPFPLHNLSDSTFVASQDTLPERISDLRFRLNLRLNQTIDLSAENIGYEPRKSLKTERMWTAQGRWSLVNSNPEKTALRINLNVKMTVRVTDKSGRVTDNVFKYNIEETVEISKETINGFSYLPNMRMR